MAAIGDDDLMKACERCGTVVLIRLNERHEKYHRRFADLERACRRALSFAATATRRKR